MNIVAVLLTVFSMMSLALSFVAPWAQRFNRHMISGTSTLYLSSVVGGPIFRTVNYNTTFTFLVEPISGIYYSTAALDARIFNNLYPNDNSYYNLEYEIYASSHGPTYLQTAISGFMHTPFFQLVAFRFLILTASNPFRGTYMIIEPQFFDSAVTSQIYTLPSKYVSGDTLSVSHFIWQMKIQVKTADVSANSNRFALSISHTIGGSAITSTIACSSYFLNAYNILKIKYLLIVVDQTALAADYYNYIVEARAISSSSMTIDFNTVESTYGSYTLLLRGMNAFDMNLISDPSMRFTINTINGTYFQSIFSGNGYSFNYGYFMIKYFDCDGKHFILNRTNNSCSEICPDGQFYNFTNLSCGYCRYDCLTCYVDSGLECRSCPANRVLVGTSCLPAAGYYESYAAAPIACTSPCTACTSPSYCTNCTLLTHLLLPNNSCIACSTLY